MTLRVRLALAIALATPAFASFACSSNDASPEPPANDAGDIQGDAGADAAPPPRVPLTCTGKTGAAGDVVINVTSGGIARTANLHVPAGYDPTKGAMLVVNYHAYGSNPDEQALLTAMNSFADPGKFLVAYPAGVQKEWNGGDCCTREQVPPVDDVQFTKDLLAAIEDQYCVEPTRIYAVGHSNGGFMAQRLGCEMADTFAAIGSVAAVLGIPTGDCKPSRPIPLLDFHGTADTTIPYDGGATSDGGTVYLSAPATVDFWRQQEGCDGTPQTTYSQGDATCKTWNGCKGGSVVTFCTIQDGGHTWPGAFPLKQYGNTSSDIDATEQFIKFFLAHPLP